MCMHIYIYIQIYIPILYVPRMTQNKNYSINSILQHDCVVVQTQTVNLYFVCFWNTAKVFIKGGKLTGEMPIDWNIFLDVWHSVISLAISVTDWTLS